MHISPQIKARAEQVYFDSLVAEAAARNVNDPFAAAALDIASMRVLDASNPMLLAIRKHSLQQTLSASI